MANPGGNVPGRTHTSIMGGIQQFTNALMNALPGHRPNWTYLEIARSHEVTELKSVGNGEEAEQWLEKMEDTLEAMKCPLNEWASTAQMDQAIIALNQEYRTLVAAQRPRTYEDVEVQGRPVKAKVANRRDDLSAISLRVIQSVISVGYVIEGVMG
ncbi:hypothetical protein ACFX1T_028274 [Malus domestica]